ncbi:major facilitator superfamily domain-containing protein [Clohesyomyces aquaticus]|uniref:Major facilitator superfamily domain-containing protein n=1 Tax=Clohesyomyces aquaticus TaxID=1231657 RepID=A0A1Y1Y2G5_9PLEO|nr:major facilitator superfamily domain-containing protein [Clohesyomyces aquaticus]
MSSAIGFFDIQSSSTADQLTTPAATHQKLPNHAPTTIELDELAFGKRYNGPPQPGMQTPRELPSGAQTPVTPKTPNELEMSRPPSPRANEGVGLMQSWNDPPVNRWRVLSCCLIYFGNGINDSAPGALIPYMEEYYHIGYAIMSLIFVGNAAGFILAAFFTNTLLGKLGRSKCLMVSEVIMLAAYIMLVTTPPFPVVVVAFFLLGYGMAINLALNNVFCANLHPPTVVLGAAHGSYGIGGIVAPIIATALVSKGTLWSRFYFISVGLRILLLPFAGWAFKSYDEYSTQTLLSALERTASRKQPPRSNLPNCTT